MSTIRLRPERRINHRFRLANFYFYSDDEKQLESIDWIFYKRKLAGNGIRFRDLPNHVFFIAAAPSLQVIGLLLVTQHGWTLLVASTLGDLVASAKAIILIASNQT